MKTFKFYFLISMFASVIIYAQAMNQFNYQAVVRNASNQVIANATIGVRLSLWNATTQIGSATTNTVVSNANGLITCTMLIPSNVDWSTGTYYIKSEIDPAGGNNYTLTSNSPLNSVPYAEYAKTAASLKNNEMLHKKIYIPANAFGYPNTTNFTRKTMGVLWQNTTDYAGFAISRPYNFDDSKLMKVTIYFALPTNPNNTFIRWKMRADSNESNIAQGSAVSGWDSIDYGASINAPLLTSYASGSYTNVAKYQTFTAQYSSTYNTQYFNSVTTGDNFNSTNGNNIWHFEFSRGAAANNGETYTDPMLVLGAEIEYWEKF